MSGTQEVIALEWEKSAPGSKVFGLLAWRIGRDDVITTVRQLYAMLALPFDSQFSRRPHPARENNSRKRPAPEIYSFDGRTGQKDANVKLFYSCKINLYRNTIFIDLPADTEIAAIFSYSNLRSHAAF